MSITPQVSPAMQIAFAALMFAIAVGSRVLRILRFARVVFARRRVLLDGWGRGWLRGAQQLRRGEKSEEKPVSKGPLQGHGSRAEESVHNPPNQFLSG